MGRAADRARLERMLNGTPEPTHNETNRVEREMREYAEGWYKQMTLIWRDRLAALQLKGTGRLRDSVLGHGLQYSGTDLSAAFRFVEYGMYVDRGTGRGYKKNNGGDLKFLDRTRRFKQGLGRPRRKTKWFSKSWWISRKIFNENMSRIIGSDFVGTFDVFR